MIGVPETFGRSTVEREGEAGAEWLGRLPGIVADLVERWGCVPDGGVMHGGVGVIVPVRRPAQGRFVLKVSFPHPGNDHEPDAFAAWGGRGAVLLHERDDAQYAMLLERAQGSTLAEEEADEVVTVAGRISRRLAVPAPPGLPRLQEQADAWEQQLRRDAEELTHTMSRQAVDAALATVSELGRVQPELLVHGDLHAKNILRADREPWLAVDPKGYVGDPAYDGGTLLKTHSLRLLDAADLHQELYRALDIFTEAAELDHERVRRWAQLHAVQTAFWGRRHGFRRARGGPQLDPYLQLADRLADSLAARV